MPRPSAGYDVPDQSGRLAVVTGASAGLGLHTAVGLVGAGARVILAVRDPERGRRAAELIQGAHPGAQVSTKVLDLADLATVRDFAGQLRAQGSPIDLLINNAGEKVLPQWTATADGLERHLGTNMIGHFALTGLLLPLLRRAPAPRVISLGSKAATMYPIDVEDLHQRRGYSPMRAYARSKQACMIFAVELQRRACAQGLNLLSAAAHPGYAEEAGAGGQVLRRTPTTTAQRLRAGLNSAGGQVRNWGLHLRRRTWISHSPAQGALPTLYAATEPEVVPGGYYGPTGPASLTGAPGPVSLPRAMLDPDTGRRLWQIAEHLAGVRYLAEE